MFASAGGGGKRIGSNKQNQHQQSQIQTQHPTHPQPHQLLQQHQAQQQQLQNNSLVHHNRQTPPQSATNSHPLQHSHTQQQQQQPQQQTVILQHQQKPLPSAHQPQQFQPHQFPVTFCYPFGNVHAAAAASGQHRPVQSTIGANSQMSPSPASLVCSSSDTINGNRTTGTNSSSIPHYMPHTTNSHLVTPGYHLQLQQSPSVMVAAQYNNVAATAAGTHTNQLSNSSAGGPGAFYQPRPRTQTPPAQQQQGLLNTQHALQYFQNNSVPLHHLQHHPPQQIRNMNMIAMVTPQPRQPFIMPSNYFALAPQALTAAPPQHQATAQGVPAVAVNSPSVAPQIQNAPQRSAILAGPTAYVHPPYCPPPIQIGSGATSLTMPPVGVLESNTGSTHINPERKKPRIHALAIINPDTGKEIDIESKKDASPSERIEAANSSEACNEEAMETEPPQQQQQQDSHVEIAFESTSVQTEDDHSLTASTASGCSDITQPTTSETEKKDKGVQTPDTEISDHDVHDEVDSSYPSKNSHPEEEETNLDIVSEYEEGQLEANILPEEEKNLTNVVAMPVVPVPDTHIATTAVSSNCQSGDSGTESLKICLYEDPNDTDADANEHELDNEDDVDLDIAKVKEIEDKPTSCVDDDNSCMPSKSNDDVKNSESNVVVQKQGRNSKKGAKHFKKNKKKSKQQQQHQQQQQKTTETIKSCSITTNRNSNNNTPTNASDNAKSTTSAIDNKIQPEQLSEQSANNLPTIDATNSSSNKSQKQKFVDLETKGDLKKDAKSKNRSPTNLIVDKKRFIRYTLEELKAMARSEESNKTPIVPCQKGGCIAQLFVARQSQQHSHHSISLTSASSQSMSNVGSLSQHHNMNTAGNKIYRINLSLKEEVKLSRSKNAWQPKVLRSKSDNNAANAEQELKKVRGVLNKLTSDNFQVLVKSMKDISLDGQENIEKVMLLIFEKTVSEPNFAQIYAKFCHVLFQEIKPESKKLFNNLLIHRLRTEFENNVNNPNAKNDTLQHITDKLKKTKDPKEKLELTNEYDVEEYKFRRRAWGTVRFIGEMYKLNCLSSDRALLCLESLLDNGNEEKLEYLCKLLITVGPQLDGNGTVARLNNIFHKIQNIVTEAKSDTTKQKVKISSRVRFMLQDVIDLRSRHWDVKPATSNAPTAMRPATQQHKNNHSSTSSNMNLNNYERVNQRMNYGNNHRQGRNSMHNNNNNMKESGISSGGHFVQKSIDIKKLNFSKGVDESSLTNTTLGNSSIYRWRNDAQQSGRNTPTSLGSGASTQKLQTPNYSQQHQQQPQHHSAANGEVKSQSSDTDIQKILNSYSAEENQKLLTHLIEEYLDCIRSRSTRWQEEIFKTWQKITQIQQICVIYYILMKYLHLPRVKQLERSACSNIFMYIMRFGPFNKKTFARAYEQFAEDFPDLLTDVPNGCSYIFEFLGPILHEGLLTFDDVWSNTWRNEKTFTERFFKALILHFTKEFGANYMRNMWRNECQFYYKKLFTTEQHWLQFVEANKFQFIFDRNVKPEFSKATNTNATSASSVEQKVQRLETLLNSADNSNLALDYINTNVNVNSAFLKRLTSFLCCDYATTMQAAAATTTTTTASSHTVSNKNSSTCSSSSGSNNSGVGGTKSPDLKTPQLNVNLFREKCMPVLRLCLDDHEDHEIICLDTIVESMLQEYDVYSAYNLICSIFDLLYDGELIPKESFDKWYRQWQLQQQQSAAADAQLQAFMQKILL